MSLSITLISVSIIAICELFYFQTLMQFRLSITKGFLRCISRPGSTQ